MKLTGTTMTLTMTFLWPLAVFAQIGLVPDAEPQRVFAGEAKQVAVVWHNGGNQIYEGEIRTRMLQSSSATVVAVGEAPWKRLQVLPGQTVLESARLNFPAVKSATRFVVQWLEDTNVIGKTEVVVYPTNLLAELKPLAGGQPLGIFDPQNQLKPLLKNLKLDFTDLENIALKNFSGRLAIIGPFHSQAQMRDGLTNQIKLLLKKGASIVWLRPPPDKRDKLSPSFYAVTESTNAVVVVQPELVDNLADNSQSQLNLIYLCKLALHPEPAHLPDLTIQP